MLDLKIIREREADVRRALESRHSTANLDLVIELDKKRREGLTQVETLKNERNVTSKKVGELKKAGQDIQEIQKAMRELGDRITALDQELRVADEQLHQALLMIPNMPHESVQVGSNAADNKLIRTHGEPCKLPFEPKPHWEIGEKLGLFDFERAARMTGAGFPLFIGKGAKLERALIQYMLDVHVNEHGYTEVAPPFVVNAASMTGTGQLPKMAEDMYFIPSDGLYLVPTAEVPVTNLYREEILRQPLPIKLTAYTPCFRREAGAAGRETRGLIRVHQFDKVEMVKFVEPENSYNELEKLVKDAEDILQRLGLTYRVIQLCTGDMSFSAAKCYDIELWAPAHNGWLEVSSCSNFEDFQARRAQ
ncbi:MAG: serine--tRNA ligase, partial [Lentisphaerota bacterium]